MFTLIWGWKNGVVEIAERVVWLLVVAVRAFRSLRTYVWITVCDRLLG